MYLKFLILSLFLIFSCDKPTEPKDCAGVAGGDAVLSGCDNACNSAAVVDECGVCGGDGSCSTIDILYITTEDIRGFQFDVTGVTLVSVSGGDAESNGLNPDFSKQTQRVIGFSMAEGIVIPAGNGVLTTLVVQGDASATCLDNLILSNSNADVIDARIEDCINIVPN